jgi:hypothetical protein
VEIFESVDLMAVTGAPACVALKRVSYMDWINSGGRIWRKLVECKLGPEDALKGFVGCCSICDVWNVVICCPSDGLTKRFILRASSSKVSFLIEVGFSVKLVP